MLASTLLTAFGLGAICWLMFTLAVYALPFWIGLSAALWLHADDHGLLVAIIGGLAAGGVVAALGEVVFARVRSVPLRLAIGLVYAIPAGLAGFHMTRGVAALTGARETASLILAGLGALVIGAAAWARIAGWSGAEGIAEIAEGDGRPATGEGDGLRTLRSRGNVRWRDRAVRKGRRPRLR
ncbi:MAG: hypothetical protein ACE37J_07205 [Pikeienuella sp.]|uniref:hypothetical protein n=1 Tax=Pikeienuella sp. TaxID=2831957 RepID=UPI003919B1B5